MTREDILREILSLKGSNWLLELATGTGKSRMAIEKVKRHSLTMSYCKILIVVPRNIHKQNWSDELKKWWPGCPFYVEYTTYVSFPKYKGCWDFVIFDECHHLSERCREALCDFKIGHSVLLSATVDKALKSEFKAIFDNLVTYKKDLRDIIENDILPDPKVYLYPIELKTDLPTESIWKNPKTKGAVIECNWAERWNYIKQRNFPVRIYCTERQYYMDLCSQIDYWKNRYMRTRNDITKNKWLRLCNDRLKWLSDKKVKYVNDILSSLTKYRTLTFCNSIEQTELLGKYCINSKNDNSVKYLERFNKGRIHHITACSMLNEGVNLTNCQIGIYNNLNSSETIIKQRMGRLLRHPNPVIIVPYFKNTREEEIIKKMLEDYNSKLVNKINNIKEIKI